MRDGFTRAPTGGFGRIGVALCPSATASNALARATWAAGSACERLMRTSQTRSWSVSFRRGSFWRRLIGKPPGEVEELAAYSTFARIATSMSSDPLVWGELVQRLLRYRYMVSGANTVDARSTQPTRGYLGSRMTTGIGRSVRSW